jgi:hypothetical protein
VNAARLIDARLNGVPFNRVLHAIESNQEELSTLPEDTLAFFESMLAETKKAVVEFEEAVSKDDLGTIRKVSESLKEIFTMTSDACNDSSRTANR